MKNFKLYRLIIIFSKNKEQGSVMVITVIVSVFIIALLGLYMMFAENIQAYSKADTRNFNAFSAASGALADRSSSILAALRANPKALSNAVKQTSTAFNCLRGTSINTGATACVNFQPNTTRIEGKYNLSEIENTKVPESYNGHTIVTDNTNYLDYANDTVQWDRLSTADNFGGMVAKSYLYTIGSLGIKQDGNNNTRAQSILQSNVSVRNIPVFQFDRFSFGADTIVIPDTGAAQALSGRYHSNGNLTVINNNSTWAVLAGRWTTSGQLSLSTGSTYVTMPTGFSLLSNRSPMAYADIYNYTSMLKTGDIGIKPLIVPSPELLKAKDGAGNLQSLYGNADIRIFRRMTASNLGVPFTLTAIQSGGSAKGGACVDLAPDRRNLSTTKCQNFSKGMLVSMLQPVLVNNKGSATEEAKYCKNQPVTDPTIAAYSPEIQDKILRAVQVVLSTNQVNRYNLSVINTLPLNDTIYQSSTKALEDPLYASNATANFSTLLNSIAGINASDIPALSAANIQSLAASRESCFLAPPIQIPTTALDIKMTTQTSASPLFLDGRENQLINLFQVNVESLAIWNRDGIYAEFPSEDLDVAEKVSSANLLTLLGSSDTADGDLWVRVPANLSKTGTLVESGLGAESLIIHNSAEALATSTLVYSNGANLPSPMSVVTDMPLYLQGNWNSVDKQPSAVMADVLTLLSENCLSKIDSYRNSFGYLISNGQPNCGSTSRELHLAADTTVNAAILSGVNPITGSNVDSTPIRYLEDWTNKVLTLKTSFVIKGSPASTSSFVSPGASGEYFRYPTTYISLDPNFAEPAGLPPGTPMVIDILGGGIDRKFKEGEKENIQRNIY